MKLTCRCGETIFDLESYKSHLLADDDLHALLERIDAAIEHPDGTSRAEARCMAIRLAVGKVLRPVWTCAHCTRMYVQNPSTGALEAWAPEQS